MSGRRIDVLATSIRGLAVLQRHALEDARGSLERMYCADELAPLTGGQAIRQINRTVTKGMGTVRGMHYQRPPHAEIKIVSCLRGQVFDVAVDLRRGSPTFLSWHGEILSARNERSLLIPEGFAHGFQALADDCEMLYLHTADYTPHAEAAVNALDPRLNIGWTLPVGARSPRDEAHPMIGDAFEGVVIA